MGGWGRWGGGGGKGGVLLICCSKGDAFAAARAMEGCVGPDLSADACVDHGEEGGWDLDEGDAPHEGGGDVAGQVPDDASAQRDAAGIPIHLVLHETARQRITSRLRGMMNL